MVRKVKRTDTVTTASWNKEPQSEAEYICMGNELVAWAQQEDSLTIDGFPISKMIAPSVFHALPAKSQQFAQAYNLALGIIGLRRERLVHEGALNAHIVRETMPLYDPMYRKWLIKEKNQEESSGETKFIIIRMPEYNLCPDGSHKEEAAAFLAQEERNAEQTKLLSKRISSDTDW